jgi:monovalent cation:H+ antiporter-2, CPA2 family
MAGTLDVMHFKDLALVLAATAIVVPVGLRLGINPVLAFLGAGVLMGPDVLGRASAWLPWLSAVTVTDRGQIAVLADAGIVFLMFMIGLELSFERLWTLRRYVFVLGAAQVVLVTAALTGALMALGFSGTGSLIVGMALALSSTAIVVQLLAEQKRLVSATGRASFSVLLFQDIAVVPLLVLVSVLSARDGGSLGSGMLLAGVKAVAAITLILLIGRYLLRPLFRSVARTKSAEFFMAACLLVVIGTGLLTSASGLSMALGAFVAGLILAETEYRREIEATIEPFKGLLIGVFFFSVGLTLDLDALVQQPLLVLGAVLALIAVKAALLFVLARIAGVSRGASLEMALLLASAGEFAFVVIGLASEGHLLDPGLARISLIIVSISMVLTPLLGWLGRRLAPPQRAHALAAEMMLDNAELATAPRVIIAGFGRIGQMVAEMLDEHKVPFVAVDGDPDLVAKARARGHQVWFGDAGRIETLDRCGLGTASVLVATMDSRKSVETIAAAAHARRGDLTIIARARDPQHAGALYKIGVTEAVPEALEASLHISEAALIGAGVPLGLAIAAVHERRDQYRAQFQRIAGSQRMTPSARLKARRAVR